MTGHRIIPVVFGGREYQVTVELFETGGHVVKKTTMGGYDFPMVGVISTLCADQIIEQLGLNKEKVAA